MRSKFLIGCLILVALPCMAQMGQGYGAVEITVPAPAAVVEAVTPVEAGLLENGDHLFKVAYVTATGVGTLGAASDASTIADKSASGKVTLTLVASTHSDVTYINIYKTKADGSVYYLALENQANANGDVVVNVADSALTVAAPSVDTASAAGETVIEPTSGYHFIYFVLTNTNATHPLYFTLDDKDVLAGNAAVGYIAALDKREFFIPRPLNSGEKLTKIRILSGATASAASWFYVEDK